MHTGDAQNICLCTSNLSIEIGWFNYLIGRVTSKDRRSTVSCMRWLLWQVHKLASKSCFAEEPQVSLLANWTTYSPLILPKHSKKQNSNSWTQAHTHTHTRACVNIEPSFLYMLTHPDCMAQRSPRLQADATLQKLTMSGCCSKETSMESTNCSGEGERVARPKVRCIFIFRMDTVDLENSFNDAIVLQYITCICIWILTMGQWTE